MPSTEARTTQSVLSLDRYKARLGFWTAIWGTLISGGVAVAIPAAVDAYKSNLDIKKAQAELQVKKLELNQRYVGSFVNTALNQDIELRIRFAEYFSFVSDGEHKSSWDMYYKSLLSKRSDVRNTIPTLQTRVNILKNYENRNIEESNELFNLSRQLDWLHAEVGYVREDSNVSIPTVSLSKTISNLQSEVDSYIAKLIYVNQEIDQISQHTQPNSPESQKLLAEVQKRTSYDANLDFYSKIDGELTSLRQTLRLTSPSETVPHLDISIDALRANLVGENGSLRSVHQTQNKLSEAYLQNERRILNSQFLALSTFASVSASSPGSAKSTRSKSGTAEPVAVPPAPPQPPLLPPAQEISKLPDQGMIPTRGADNRNENSSARLPLVPPPAPPVPWTGDAPQPK